MDLPNTSTRCALRRRSWLAGSMMRGRPRGEGLGIPSPHLGCHLRTLRSCSSSTSSSTSLSCRKRRFSWSRLFSRLQSFHSCSTFQVLDVPVVLVVLCSQCACPQLQLAEPIVMFTVPWIGCTIVATANVVTSSSSAVLLTAAGVFPSRCRVVVVFHSWCCLRCRLGQCEADDWKFFQVFPVPRVR